MKVLILCGGFGARLREETEVRPKPMVEIGGKPILWHIMKTYAFYGYKDFVLCLGYKSEIIKRYFFDYDILTNDFTIDLASRQLDVHRSLEKEDWKITMADTGVNAMTGARIKRAEKYIGNSTFMVTYGDGVTDLNINELLDFHKSHKKIGTVTGVVPPSRYGELLIQGREVVSFREKPEGRESFISGGYFIFNSEIFDYLHDGDDCILERQPLERLSRDGQLVVYNHHGFWQCMDTYRDLEYLRRVWSMGSVPWCVWDKGGG